MGDIDSQRWDGIAECYRRHGKALLRVIGCHVDNPHLAEELLQDLLLKLYEKNVNLDPDLPTTRNYLMIIARNHSYDFLKKYRWESKHVVNMNIDTLEIEASTLQDLEEAVVRGEIISTLHDTLDALSGEDREIYIRKTFRGRTTLEIARETGLSVFKVNTALRRATLALRAKLRDFNPG